jgi:hypothetical protein
MQTIPSSFTIADYCKAMERDEIVVNPDYQRSDQVWPPPARSFLLETVLLGFPMPKISLYQVTDIKSKKIYKEIVDGQQRSMALFAFYKDELRLSKSLETEEIAGRKYSTLPDEYKGRFLDYPLSTDIYVSATPDEVREVFRRMNSYTVPLNAEEQRHAIYQGEFKWFVHRLGRHFNDLLVRMGVFGDKQLVRMADTKLFSELCHALINGIQTTKGDALTELYKVYDEAFPHEEAFEQRISKALDRLAGWNDLFETPVMRPHMVYALLLALMHLQKPIAKLKPAVGDGRKRKVNDTEVLANLSALGAAVERGDEEGPFADFVEASSSKTNVGSQRRIRVRWFYRALTEPSIH